MKKVYYEMEIRKFTDNGYDEFYIFHPGSCDDGELIKTVDVEFEVENNLADQIFKFKESEK